MRSRLALLLLLALPACSQRASSSSTATTAPARVEAPAGAPVVQAEPELAPRGEPIPDPAPEPPAERNAPFVLDAIAGLPDDLITERPLWETIRGPDATQPTLASRLYADGRFYRFSARCRTVVDGKDTWKDAPLAWRLEATVSQQGLVEVERQIRDQIKRGSLLPPDEAPRVDLKPEQASLTKRTWLDGVERVILGDGDGTEKMWPWSKIDYAIRTGQKGTREKEQC